MMRLTADDITELEVGPVRDAANRITPWSAVQASLRPGLAVPCLLPDGKLPVYWMLASQQWELPTDLVKALDRCAGARFGKGLTAVLEVAKACEAEYTTTWQCRHQTIMQALGRDQLARMGLVVFLALIG
jgi:hypothetical protein